MLINDIRFAVRALARSRTFTITALVTLALGISVTTAIFSLIDTVLLTVPPFDSPDRIVVIGGENRLQGLTGSSVAYPDVLDWRAGAHSFQEIAVLRRQTFNVAADDRAERVNGQRVSANFFRVFGVPPQLGRPFLAEEETLGRDRVVVLSDAYWRRRFGASPGIVGRQILMNGWLYTVVGVMPSGFAYPPNAEVWSPFAPDSPAMHRGSRYVRAVGRLVPGATPRQGAAELNAIARRLEGAYPSSNTGWRASATAVREDLAGRAPRLLYTLLGAVAFVLLIACANVANLLLARGSGRAREVAVRKALGASSWRLTRQLVTESIVLALGGAIIGVLLTLWELRLFKAVVPITDVAPWQTIQVSGRGLAFTLLLAVLTGIIAGIVPALRVGGGSVRESLATGVRGSGSARRSGAQRGLVVVEVALAVALLAGAGLLLTSLSRLQAVSPGFSADGVLIARLTLAGPRYESREAMTRFYDEVLGRLRETPGVTAAGAAGALPLSGSANTANFHLPGREEPKGGGPTSRWERVTPGYFRALGIPLQAGREFGSQDNADAPSPIIVNESWARTFFPGERNVVGRVVRLGGSDKPSTIVGLVGDVRHDGLGEPAQPTMFLAYAQAPEGGMTLVVRSSGDAATMTDAVRNAVRGVDATIPLYDVSTMQEQVSRSIIAQRLSSSLISIFAAMALVLATVGVYGLIAYSVAERRHEIGIRLALGAQGQDVRRLVVGQGVRLTLAGVGIGLIGAILVGRGIRSMLYGISAIHVPTLMAVSGILLSVAVLASWVPARRAARTDLLGALRGE